MKLARTGQPSRGMSRPGMLSPFLDLDRLRQEINRVFEQPLGALSQATGFFGGWNPSVDIYDDRDHVIVKAEMPGMKREEIEVSLTNDTLTISGERKKEQETKGQETYRSERFFGRFQRSITLPQPVDPTRIEANYKDGVLTITCPKSEEAKRRQIEVKVP